MQSSQQVKKQAITFELVKSFMLRVPTTYNHQVQLHKFSEQFFNVMSRYHTDITDKNFSRVTHQLKPGTTYKVSILNIDVILKGEQVIDFMKTQENVVFVGAQGLSLVYQEKPDQLGSIEKRIILLDQLTSLWVKNDGGKEHIMYPVLVPCKKGEVKSGSFVPKCIDHLISTDMNFVLFQEMKPVS